MKSWNWQRECVQWINRSVIFMTRSLFRVSFSLPNKVLLEDWAFCIPSYEDLLGFIWTSLYLQWFSLAGHLGVVRTQALLGCTRLCLQGSVTSPAPGCPGPYSDWQNRNLGTSGCAHPAPLLWTALSAWPELPNPLPKGPAQPLLWTLPCRVATARAKGEGVDEQAGLSTWAGAAAWGGIWSSLQGPKE